MATSKRQLAAALLRAASQNGRGVETDIAASAVVAEAEPLADSCRSRGEAELTLQLAGAYADLEQWEEAERSYVRAVSFLEEADGFSDSKVVALWGEIAALRMRRHEYGLASRDYAHVLEMSKLLHGPQSALLIPHAERLCKAFVLMRRWREARDALELAHQLATSKHGNEHSETARIAAVLKSLDKYAPPRADMVSVIDAGARGMTRDLL